MENQWIRIVEPGLSLLQGVFECNCAAVDDEIEDDRCDFILISFVDEDSDDDEVDLCSKQLRG